jgi:hypothetical protein
VAPLCGDLSKKPSHRASFDDIGKRPEITDFNGMTIKAKALVPLACFAYSFKQYIKNANSLFFSFDWLDPL